MFPSMKNRVDRFPVDIERHKNQVLKNKELVSAIVAGDLERVKAVLANGADGYSALSHALKEPSLAVFTYLLKHKANPNFVFSNGETLLGWAVLNSTPDRVGLLLEHGANPNKPNKEGVTPLKMILESTTVAMLFVFLDSGATIDWQDTKNLSVTQKENLFYQVRANIDSCTNMLVESIENENDTIECIGLLNKLTKNMEGSASIQTWPLSPVKRDDLKYLRSWIREELVKKITKKIDELNGVESLQKAVVGLQIIMDNLTIIKGMGSVGFTKKASMALLEACMIELNERIVEEKQREKQAEEEDVEAAKPLILAGIDPNGEGAFGDAELLWAARKNNEAMAEMLLNLGAKINWPALSETNSMKACVIRALSKTIFQDIDDLFQFHHEVNNRLALLNEKTAYFVSSEFKGERAKVRNYFVKKMNEIRKELAPVIDLLRLKTARDRFCLIEKTMVIIQSPEGEKEKDSMRQLRQWIYHLNERIAKLVGEEKLKYQPGLTQFASVDPVVFDHRSELGPDAGYTL